MDTHENISYSLRTYSPVALSKEWPAVTRLLIMSFCSIFGTIMNGFFVASFITEQTLIRIGLVFLACVGVADLIVSTLVMPVSAVVLLSGQWDNIYVCQFVALSTEFATYAYSIFFLLVAVENYYRLCRTSAEYEIFLTIGVGCVAIIIFIFCFILAAVGVFWDLDYDYCERKHHGHFYYRVITTTMFYIIPCILTIFCLLSSALRVCRRAREQAQYRRTVQYDHDNTITKINLAVFLIYATSWTPYLIVCYINPDTSDVYYYNSIWIGVSRFIVSSIFYATIDRRFRKAFGNLSKYVFCKNALPTSMFSRHRRTSLKRGEIRVHIMHHAVSRQRETVATCETRDL